MCQCETKLESDQTFLNGVDGYLRGRECVGRFIRYLRGRVCVGRLVSCRLVQGVTVCVVLLGLCDSSPTQHTPSNATTTGVRTQSKHQSESQLQGDPKRQKTYEFEIEIPRPETRPETQQPKPEPRPKEEPKPR